MKKIINVVSIDDDNVVINCIKYILQNVSNLSFIDNFEFHYHYFNDFQDFWKTEDKEKYDVILLDNYLPTINGVDAMLLIREELPNTSCIMISSSEDMRVCRQFFRNGGDDYLIKPFDKDNLIYKIVSVFQHKKYIEDINYTKNTLEKLFNDLNSMQMFLYKKLESNDFIEVEKILKNIELEYRNLLDNKYMH